VLFRYIYSTRRLQRNCFQYTSAGLYLFRIQ